MNSKEFLKGKAISTMECVITVKDGLLDSISICDLLDEYLECRKEEIISEQLSILSEFAIRFI